MAIKIDTSIYKYSSVVCGVYFQLVNIVDLRNKMSLSCFCGY